MTSKTSLPPGYLTVSETAQRLGIGEDEVRQRCRSFQLPAKRTEDGEWGIWERDLERRRERDQVQARGRGIIAGYGDFEEKRRAARLPAPSSQCTVATTVPRTRPRARGAGRPAARRTTVASRAGPSDDDSGEPEPPRRWPPADHLLRDVGDYLGRLDGHGADRGWLVDQVSSLGYPAERVGAALALAVANRQARRGTGDDGSDVIWAVRS